MKLIGLIRYLVGRFPWLCAALAVSLAVSSTLEGLTLLTLVPVMDYVLDPHLQTASRFTRAVVAALRWTGAPVVLSSLLGLSVAFAILTGVTTVASGYVTLRVKYAVLRDLLMTSFERFYASRWEFFSSSSQGTLLNTFTREITNIGDSFYQLALLFASLCRIGAYLTVPLVLSWRVTLASVGIGAVFSLPFLLLSRVSYRLGRRNTLSGNALFSVLHENLTLAKVILGFGNHGKALDRLGRAFDDHRRATVKFWTLNLSIGPAFRPVGLFALGAALFFARRAGVGLPETGIILLSLFQLIPLVGSVMAQRSAVSSFFPSFEQVRELQQKAERLEQKSGSRVFTGLERELKLEGVSFAYPGCKETLTGINLTIPKGRMLAIVGESGVGKSTLVDLIMGLHEPTAGRILVDGIPLSEFDVRSYRARIGYVPQDSTLFNMSIRDNLLWANDQATESDLRQATEEANAVDFIEALAAGLETVVGDRGVRLSGGQIQRLALARATLRSPALLILDEATSSLDSRSERLIQDAIEAIVRDRTVVVIAHRLSTVRNADFIIVLKGGRIVEQGSYETLLAHDGGSFQDMARMQNLGV